MIKAVFSVTDEGDEGASPLLDMTKVTRSTLADKPLPQPRVGDVQRSLEQGLGTINHASKRTKFGEASQEPKMSRLLADLLNQSRF